MNDYFIQYTDDGDADDAAMMMSGTEGLGNMGLDVGSVLNMATGGAVSSVENKADQVIGDVETYIGVQLALQFLVSAATFGIFLIALYKILQDRKD